MPDLHVEIFPIGSVSISKNQVYAELFGSDSNGNLPRVCLYLSMFFGTLKPVITYKCRN